MDISKHVYMKNAVMVLDIAHFLHNKSCHSFGYLSALHNKWLLLLLLLLPSLGLNAVPPPQPHW